MVATPWIDCTVCGLRTAHPLIGDDGRSFCCPACREVAGLLAQPVEHAAPATDVATSEIRLQLGGLWCTSCAWLVRETLQRAPGVQSAEISFVQRIARVVVDPARIGAARVAQIIRRLGYTARLPGEPAYDEEESLFTRLAISSVFVLHDVIIGAILYTRDLLGMNTPEDAWLITFFQAMMLLGLAPLLIVIGIPILRAGIAGLLCGRPDMHTLITFGTVAAVALSIYHLAVGIDRVYFDTASMLLFLVAVGRWLELRAQQAGNRAVSALLERLPQQALLLTPEGERSVDPEQVPLGAKVRVHPGERFPVDGLIAAGDGDVDESLLTGEPAPITCGPGGRVYAGTVNLDGVFDVVTLAVGADTTVGRIGHVLHQALWQRAPVERMADRLAALMVPIAVFLALGAFVFWSMQAGVEVGLLTALAVLLIACPCALGIATPLALAVTLGKATEAGAIPRSTAAIERLTSIRSIFFDKTGTLTRLPLHVHALATDGSDRMVFLQRVAAVESHSEHPLAHAIMTECRQYHIPLDAASDICILGGRGVGGLVDGIQVWVGNRHLIAEQQLCLSDLLAELADSWEYYGMTVVYAGWNGRVTGLIGFGEDERPEASRVLALLQHGGLSVGVLSGDTHTAGKRWEQVLRIPVQAELLPEGKMERLRMAQGPVAMVGDGINDGPALAAASVGIAVGHGTDVARATADIILLNDDLRMIPWLFELAHATVRTVRQNLAWAFFYNIIGLALALTGQLQPVLAAAAMVLSSVLVTANALRLRRFPLPPWIAAGSSNNPTTHTPSALAQDLA